MQHLGSRCWRPESTGAHALGVIQIEGAGWRATVAHVTGGGSRNVRVSARNARLRHQQDGRVTCKIRQLDALSMASRTTGVGRVMVEGAAGESRHAGHSTADGILGRTGCSVATAAFRFDRYGQMSGRQAGNILGYHAKDGCSARAVAASASCGSVVHIGGVLEVGTIDNRRRGQTGIRPNVAILAIQGTRVNVSRRRCLDDRRHRVGCGVGVANLAR